MVSVSDRFSLRPCSWRPSEDLEVPFVCDECGRTFDDSPALVVVDVPEGHLRFCTDGCAEHAGWTEAVVLRWDMELAARFEAIEFTPAVLIGIAA